MRFQLSNRQLKEIEVRATGLLIAIPAPVEPPADELGYARDRLAVPVEWIRSVQLGEVSVNPRVATAPTGLPAIIAGEPNPDWLTLRVVVLLVVLAAGDRRRTEGKLQWPGGEIER